MSAGPRVARAPLALQGKGRLACLSRLDPDLVPGAPAVASQLAGFCRFSPLWTLQR